ncbi:MAG: molecular chaperone TorD family protein [Chloroflexota bacterium]
MTDTPIVAQALRILAHFWLEEVRPNDAEIITALPELATALPDTSIATLDELAVEYQRLFGFNLPPYESIFIDPSAMLMAPATERVQALYRQGQWRVPSDTRTGAPDHIGVELLALADWLEARKAPFAHQLQTEHLALWVPPFVLALQRLSPHPFYIALSDLTVDLVLATLPMGKPDSPDNLFPDLPPPPVYKGSGETAFDLIQDIPTDTELQAPIDPNEFSEGNSDVDKGDDSVSLRRLIKGFLPPREAGLFITREDLARISQALELPISMGERYIMLETLFRQAGQYDLLPTLFEQLTRLLVTTKADYDRLAEEYPNWRPYAQAWNNRLGATEVTFADLNQQVDS